MSLSACEVELANRQAGKSLLRTTLVLPQASAFPGKLPFLDFLVRIRSVLGSNVTWVYVESGSQKDPRVQFRHLAGASKAWGSAHALFQVHTHMCV